MDIENRPLETANKQVVLEVESVRASSGKTDGTDICAVQVLQELGFRHLDGTVSGSMIANAPAPESGRNIVLELPDGLGAKPYTKFYLFSLSGSNKTQLDTGTVIIVQQNTKCGDDRHFTVCCGGSKTPRWSWEFHCILKDAIPQATEPAKGADLPSPDVKPPEQPKVAATPEEIRNMLEWICQRFEIGLTALCNQSCKKHKVARGRRFALYVFGEVMAYGSIAAGALLGITDPITCYRLFGNAKAKCLSEDGSGPPLEEFRCKFLQKAATVSAATVTEPKLSGNGHSEVAPTVAAQLAQPLLPELTPDDTAFDFALYTLSLCTGMPLDRVGLAFGIPASEVDRRIRQTAVAHKEQTARIGRGVLNLLRQDQERVESAL